MHCRNGRKASQAESKRSLQDLAHIAARECGGRFTATSRWLLDQKVPTHSSRSGVDERLFMNRWTAKKLQISMIFKAFQEEVFIHQSSYPLFKPST